MIDIGANLTDETFAHVTEGASEIDFVIIRAILHGVSGLILTGGDLRSSSDAISLCRKYSSPERIDRHLAIIRQCFPADKAAYLSEARQEFTLKATVGVHPCHAQEFESTLDVQQKLISLIEENKDLVVAAGECGLDYDRENFCPRDIQAKHFPCQIEIAKKFSLPLFFHNRNTQGDFLNVVRTHAGAIQGVVHSYTGPLEEMLDFVKLGLYIGVNGCSLKTEENCAVVREIPLERMLIETDAPYCEIRATHAGNAFLQAALKNIPYDSHFHTEKPLALKKPKYIAALTECSVILKSENRMTTELIFNTKVPILASTLKSRNEPCRLPEVALAIYEIKRQAGVLSGISFSAFLSVLHANTKALFKM